MRSFILMAALCAAMPLAAQDQPAPQQDKDKPAQQQDRDKPAQQQDKPPAQQNKPPAPPVLEKPGMAAPEPTQPEKTKPAPKKPAEGTNARTVEEIIARVNNEIITRSEFEKARVSAEDDARQECQGKCTPEQLKADIDDRQKNTLRDLIDQSLLVQRGKDMGINVEPEVIKRLDQIRIDNKFPDMDGLENAVSKQGTNWEDFKNNIRNGILTQRVIGQEVGSHIVVGHDEVEKYYKEHQDQFVRPEQVAVAEILVSTEGKPESELPELKKKAETARKRVLDGEDFSEMAKRFSDGSTAKQGGFLGVYKRGELSKELEDIVFKMKKKDLTEVLDTKQGYLVLDVLERYEQGLQPLNKVENEITDRIYSQKMEPALREYLKTLREQSYVVIKPGYEEGAGGGNSEIQEVSAMPEASKSKKGHKRFLLFGKRSGSSSKTSS